MSDYIRGNTAYQYEPMYEAREPQPAPQAPRGRFEFMRPVIDGISRTLDTARSIMPMVVRVVAIALAFVCISGMCIAHLSMRTQINAVQKEINEKKARIETLQRENEALLSKINTAKNVYHIMEQASAMGMTQPRGNAIIYVERVDVSTLAQMKAD